MKIAFLSTMSIDPWGGSEELWSRTARFALERGHQVAVVCSRWPQTHPRIRELQERGARLLPVERFQDQQRAGSFRRRIAIKIELVRIWGRLASWEPDVVCVSQGGTYDLLSRWCFAHFLDRQGAPYVLICQHNSDHVALWSEHERLTAAGYFKRARHVAFVSERNLRAAERQLATSLPGACVVRNPVNLSNFSPVPYSHSDVVKMATVARFDVSCKGQDVLLEALGGGNWKRRPWLLRFYGTGSDRAYLERLVGHFQLEEKVEFCGHVRDIRALWADNHLLVLPSRSEGTPLSLVEAMICGRPSVVTDVGGNTEWVDEPSTGFVAEAPSEMSLNRALERAWEARDSWESIGLHAREVALSRYDGPRPEESVLSLLVNARGLPTGRQSDAILAPASTANRS